jgi:predicted ATP-dependent serine protease
MQARRPAITVIDSIQKWSDDPEEQVKICESLKAFAVELKCPVLVISQVTKADDFAGLNKLKHTVDCLIMLTCDDDEVRILQSEKNRYGDTAGVLFDMTEKGLILRIEDEDDDDEGDEDNG